MRNLGHERKARLILGLLSMVLVGSGVCLASPASGNVPASSLFAFSCLCAAIVAGEIVAGSERRYYIFLEALITVFFLLTVWRVITLCIDLVKNEFTLFSLLSFVVPGVFFIVLVLVRRKKVVMRFGLKTLSPTQALSYRALAEASIGKNAVAGYSFDTVVTDFDAYLSSFESGQKNQVKLVYLAMQFLPILFLRPPLTWMGADTRKAFLKKRISGSTGKLQTLTRSAKQLVYFMYYGSRSSFASTGYVMFEERARYKAMPQLPPPEPLRIITVRDNTEIHTDICVIGSGAGGAVAAYELGKLTGKRVTIIDRGKYYIPERDFTNIEPDMIGRVYRDGGLEMTQDFDLAILQGNCVGGSTTINNGICFRTPPSILAQWEQLGTKIDIAQLDRCFDRVESTIRTQPLDQTKTNAGANRFFDGARRLGLAPEWFSTNFRECGGSGYCNIGCKYGRKLSMLLNYLPLAQKDGAEIIADAAAVKIILEGAKARNIRCITSAGIPFTVHAQHIVIAAGAIASSAILLRSGITHNVGTRLSFNLTTPMMAEFPEVVNSFDGVQMCCFVRGDGFLVETTFNPPGTSALIMQGWFEVLNDRMKNYSHYATAAPVVGSGTDGTVRRSLFGKTVVKFPMSDTDFERMKEGMKMACRIFLAAGATSVLPSSYADLVIRSASDIERIDSEIRKHEDISISSAHPQGGNPISSERDIGAVDMNFRVYGYDNLYVTDASIFPAGVQVNPQLSIMALATYASERIAANF
jgi:choline dehydrogenase-like flavoprotein